MSTRRDFLKKATAVPFIISLNSPWEAPDNIFKEKLQGDLSRLRIIIETDAGGDPDDEQSLVRFLLYSGEFDIEGIIANRQSARDPENKNPVRNGLGIVRAMVYAYRECFPNLLKHCKSFPNPDRLFEVTVPGYDNTDDGVNLIINAVDRDDPRPVWFCNWGTDHGSAVSCLKRALDRILAERGPEGYARFKNRIRLSSSDKFGDHTTAMDPPFKIWIDTFRPPIDGKRWYHRFSPLTARAGGFDLERDVRTGHGPLGPLYPINTGLPQKEGDTMCFLYLVSTGMNDPDQPEWGSWGGRYGRNEEYPGRNYYWANQTDYWKGKTDRDNTLLRWAEAFQNDFRVRMDWCIMPYSEANHHPFAIVNGDSSKKIIRIRTRPGRKIHLDARKSYDPDGRRLFGEWFTYPEAGTLSNDIVMSSNSELKKSISIPPVSKPETVHIIFQLKNDGTPALYSYRRIIIEVQP